MNNSIAEMKVIAAPSIRKLARENNLNLKQLAGSGKNGRILRSDLDRAFQEYRKTEVIMNSEKQWPVTKEIPFHGLRKQIAQNMTHSVQTIPHVTHFEEVDVTNAAALREQLKATGEHISFVVFYLKALAIALHEHPVFNAMLDEDNGVIKLHKQINIGLATDTRDGLVIPVLKEVQHKSMKALQFEVMELTRKAQESQLHPQTMDGGTFTINYTDPIGGIGATPIISHPQTGIMAFHKIKRIPVDMVDDKYTIRCFMNLSFSFDHRVADGVEAVMFANRFVELMAQPEKLMLA